MRINPLEELCERLEASCQVIDNITISRGGVIAILRIVERRARDAGRFDSAVLAQNKAYAYASTAVTETLPLDCQWLDHGVQG